MMGGKRVPEASTHQNATDLMSPEPVEGAGSQDHGTTAKGSRGREVSCEGERVKECGRVEGSRGRGVEGSRGTRAHAEGPSIEQIVVNVVC